MLHAPFPVAFLAQSTDGYEKKNRFSVRKNFRVSYGARARATDPCRVDACTL